MLTRGLFFVLTLPWVVIASLILTRRYKRLHFDELVASLQKAPVLLPQALHRPSWLCCCARHTQQVLPPYDLGSCLKHSLLMLRLLAWCGLKSRLHLGIMSDGHVRQLHAWISIEVESNDRSAGFVETWVSRE